MDPVLTCRCGEVLIKSVNGTTKVRGKIIIFREGKGFSVCKGCGVEQPIPLTLNEDALQLPARPALFVSKSKGVK